MQFICCGNGIDCRSHVQSKGTSWAILKKKRDKHGNIFLCLTHYSTELHEWSYPATDLVKPNHSGNMAWTALQSNVNCAV